MLAWRRQEPQRQERVVLDRDTKDKIRPLASFVRLLHDRHLIEYSKKNHSVPFVTRLQIQKFVYFATQFFDLGLPYRFIEYAYGPHALLLTNDYHDIEDIYDYDAITEAEWPRMNEFLEFAKDRGPKWLEIASTILFTKSEKELTCDDLVKHVKYRKSWADVQSVYDELVKEGMLSATEK